MVAARTLPVDRWLLGFVAWIRGAGAAGMIGFAVAYVVATVLFLPGSILTLGAGFAYGVAVGSPLVWMSANVGAALAFVLGRTLARDAIARRVAGNARFAAIDRAVGRQGFRIVLLTRLSPVFPFNLLNYAFGLTRVAFRDYVLGSVLGMIPGTVMYVYLGSLLTSVTELASGRRSGGAAQEAFYFGGLVATIAVTVYVTRVARRALAEATEERGAARERSMPDVPAREPDAPTLDAHDRARLAHVHPPAWRNPTPRGRYNLVVVGGGTAGLVSAAGAAGLGARAALVERHLLGGDCLNVGCVPSKAIIAAARAAADARDARRFGVTTGDVAVDFAAVMERMRRIRAGLAPHDGAPRFTELGVDVYLGDGRFTGPATLEVDGRRLEFSRAVVATGARAAAPPIAGLADAGYLTNETLFDLTELPRRLAVVGAGPIGCEMAQAFARLGSTVTLLEAGARILPREDADAADLVARRMAADGVQIVVHAEVTHAARRDGARTLRYAVAGASHEVACDAILVGVGRAPNVEGLGLEAAAVAYDATGVRVDDRLRTTNPRIFAAGDVASPWKFTHTADATARIVLTNALFPGRARASVLHVPWCTYTSPEVAHVGWYEKDAAAHGVPVRTMTIPFADVDRARLEGDDDGFLRVHVDGKGTIRGATLVAPHAGETISEITLAMVGKVRLGTIASVIHPYPTEAEAIRKAADAWNRGRLTPAVKRVFDWWLAWRR